MDREGLLRSLNEHDARQAAMDAPRGPGPFRADTRVIDRPGWYQLITPSTRSAYLNEVGFSAVATADADRVIEETVAGYAAHGLPTKWCVGPWTEPAPERFGERLAARGFASWEVRGMVRDTALALDAGAADIAPVGLDELPEAIDVAMAGWGMPPDQRDLEIAAHRAALAADPPAVHLFAARIDGRIAATAGLLLRPRCGYLVGAQVLDRFRGRGLYRALIAARLAFLRARGFSLAVTQAREATSAPMLEHLGWETAFRSRCWLLEA